ncbi:STAS domain-containing protein [Nonomuraea turkmeniaca]|uniref:Anti-sigma factor antagonist n=1 Tax=Nonomuraea turkmeniaca TaxID=103838 RepID=A0A5S4F988_9ACTN|nr:STAS domain-containing protein [Nonomuraea turkmeniaca]TMR13296.1 STAS domain-containing protein [Nonomuraea turkmeniaca]
MAPLSLTHQHLPGMSVIAIAGEVDKTNSAELADYVERIRRPRDHVIFDLAELTFLDSSGLHVLLSCARTCADDDADVHLAAAQGSPARLLHVTGVDVRLPTYVTTEHAIATVLATRTS